MNLEWWQIAVAAAGAAYVAWKKRDTIKAAMGGIMPTTKADPVLDRLKLALELRVVCEKACPEALKHIDAAIPHLLPGHVEGAK